MRIGTMSVGTTEQASAASAASARPPAKLAKMDMVSEPAPPSAMKAGKPAAAGGTSDAAAASTTPAEALSATKATSAPFVASPIDRANVVTVAMNPEMPSTAAAASVTDAG